MLEELGFSSIIELDEMDAMTFQGGAVTSVPFMGEHGDLAIRGKAGYHLRLGDRSLTLLAASCNLDPALYRHVARQLGSVDQMFLGMECDGAPLTFFYGPLRTDEPSRRQNYAPRLIGSDLAPAMELVDCFKVRQLYVYAMGYEPWCTYILALRYDDQSNSVLESNRVVEHCRARGIAAERLYGKKELVL